jgi:hypothetical protein
MMPGQGKRSWVKLWTNEWLDGTTRYQMSDAQRAFWIDLLAMAGRSRFPGIVCAGRDGKHLVGYPLNRFESLMSGPIDIEATLKLFERTGKVKITITSVGPPKLVAIELLSWKKYQSDLDAQAERARNYRSRKKQRDATVTDNVTQTSRGVTGVEGEGEEESETESEREKEGERASLPLSPAILPAFDAMKCEPFGDEAFQKLWGEECSTPGSGGFSDAMERCIRRAKRLKIDVPGRFYEMKREIEKTEAATAGHELRRRTPL